MTKEGDRPRHYLRFEVIWHELVISHRLISE